MSIDSGGRVAPNRFRLVALTVALVGVLVAQRSHARDFQLLALGNGFPDSECLLAGPNGVLNSTPAGDDRVFNPTTILSGKNGICETPLGGDDVRPPNGVTLNKGLPSGPMILAGTPGVNDGICNDVVAPGGDDVVRVAAGKSEPRTLAIGPGANNVVNSTTAGDDVQTAVICPGPDAVIQTVPDPADALSVTSALCDLCVNSFSCIIPGVDDVLQTSADPQDVLVPYVSTGSDGIAQSSATPDDVQVIAVGKGSAKTVCVDAGPDGIAETSLCGNGIVDDDENGLAGTDCEDGNLVSEDGCSALCQVEFCGDGITQAGLGEECDDGNNSNRDACVIGCKNAFCGDGFLRQGVEECEPPNTATCDASCLRIALPKCGDRTVDPGEECDDGNKSNQDDCLRTCELAACGDGFVHTKGTPPFEECDDGNTAPGDGCSATCTKECGNGVLDGACSEGTVGAACSADSDCDSPPAAGNGVCVGETCDPGTANLCAPGPQVCSEKCLIAECGNGVVECQEACDLGVANGIPGSGCTVTCGRNVVGANEISRKGECTSAWTLDSPPGDLARRSHACRDGDTCDFDAIAGQCTFRVGVCLNRAGVPGCTPGGVNSFDLLRVDVLQDWQAAAAEAITAAVRDLAPGDGSVPDRCRLGLRGKVCSIPDDAECDRFFGAGDGACDVGTGVLFDPALEPADLGGNQLSPCTPGVDVVVPLGAKLGLQANVLRIVGRPDKDRLRLSCVP